MADQGTKFIRVHGRVVPIKGGKGAPSGKKSKIKKPSGPGATGKAMLAAQSANKKYRGAGTATGMVAGAFAGNRFGVAGVLLGGILGAGVGRFVGKALYKRSKARKNLSKAIDKATSGSSVD